MQHLDEGTLQAWLDRDRSGLDEGERAEIERHLDACDACARRLEEMDEVGTRAADLFAAEADVETVPAFAGVVERARLNREDRRRRSRWTRAGWTGSVAAAIVAGWFANDLYRADLDRQAKVTYQAESASSAPAARQEEAAEIESPDAIGPAEAESAEAAPSSGSAANRGATASPAIRTPAAPPPPAPTPPAVVRGRVTDEAGRPLASAQVAVEGTSLGSLTAPDGSFAIVLGDVPADSATRDVTLVADLVGYSGERRAVAVWPRDVASTDFRLAQRTLSLDEIVATGAAGEQALARRERADAKAAPALFDDARIAPSLGVPRAQAEAALGFALLTVPELPVVRIEVRRTDGVDAAWIHQRLDDGGVLVLVEAAADVEPEAPAPGESRVTRRRGEVRIVATAAVGEDLLEALLDRIR